MEKIKNKIIETIKQSKDIIELNYIYEKLKTEHCECFMCSCKYRQRRYCHSHKHYCDKCNDGWICGTNQRSLCSHCHGVDCDWCLPCTVFGEPYNYNYN